MLHYVGELQNVAQKSGKSWRKIVSKRNEHVVLRLISCIQIASKLTSLQKVN